MYDKEMSSSTDICIIIRGVSTEHIALIGEQGLGFGGESVYMIICIYFMMIIMSRGGRG